ncbi:hypothetical protein RJT34_13606 [Clitoria ternatea]|uniref:Uncharacterized protein n=1 Tax=Clitoria ternatea TaxID=43366 RepID=A0AAN9JNV8_CLITE
MANANNFSGRDVLYLFAKQLSVPVKYEPQISFNFIKDPAAAVQVGGEAFLPEVTDPSHTNNLVRWEGGDNIQAAKILLPKLQKLRLEFMPKLKEIYSEFIGFPCSVHVLSCDALKRLPFDLDDAVGLHQQLLEIRGTKYWWDSLEWDEPAVKQIMQAYFLEWCQIKLVAAAQQEGVICKTISVPSLCKLFTTRL